MRSAFSIIQNEATASERTVFGIPVRDPALDNQFATGLTFQHATVAVVDLPTGGHGAKEVEVWNGAAWVEAANNAGEDGTSGNYNYIFTQAETNHAGRIGVRLSKTGYATSYFWVTIIPAETLPASVGDVQTLIQTDILRNLLGEVSGSALHVAPTSLAITHGFDGGAPSGGLSSLYKLNNDTQTINADDGTLDFTLTFVLPAGAVPTYCRFVGVPYSSDDAGFLEVYSGAAADEQIGTLPISDFFEEIDGYFNHYRSWPLIPAMADVDGNVKIRFKRHASQISEGIDIDQILVGYLPQSSTDVNVVQWLGSDVPTPTVDGVPQVEVFSMMTNVISAAALSAAAAAKQGVAVWAQIQEGSLTYGDGMRSVLSGVLGRVTDFTTGVLEWLSADGTKVRWRTKSSRLGRYYSAPGDTTP